MSPKCEVCEEMATPDVGIVPLCPEHSGLDGQALQVLNKVYASLYGSDAVALHTPKQRSEAVHMLSNRMRLGSIEDPIAHTVDALTEYIRKTSSIS